MIRRIAVGLILCLVMAAPAAARTPAAVVDLTVVSQLSRVAIDADAQLFALFGTERAELEAIATELNAQYEELAIQASIMSESAINSKYQELQTRAAALDNQSMEYTQRLSVIQQSLTMQMQEVLNMACSNYAIRNDIDLILDGQAALYVLGSLDITTDIIEEVNRVWEARGSKFTLPN